ncbi:stage V sporulation protein D (sporulation-specific penicillin-binding protein) [Clostridium algifaecis]|uniref:Stage V sporulation protein D (Sporulation-specific penicillin-binding protein) n=1 Tax=Clostridium algifaecis TaxID=1472040 RepID=A0ABS4KPM7_9CLOT|nr:penicillin-binding transpeptidase domain-containing protein [Clostridium algifaecis]MBP2031993.1 stage V sporulation protein D (sporulation-specific penicillin-binding protein) [Clostridium algifaecis]
MSKKKSFSSRNRLLAIFFIFLIVLIVIIGRLSYIAIAQGDWLRLLAEKQWTDKTLIKPVRGQIVDRNYNQLVTNENDYRIDIDLKTLKQSIKTKKLTMDDVESKLSGIIGMNIESIDKIIKTSDSYKVLERGISNDQKNKVEKLGINGIIISPDTKRYYVNGSFLSQVLGYTDSDGKGVSGVELSYDKILTGTPGLNISQVDSKRSDLPYQQSVYTKPVDGKDLALTIDANLQLFVEKEAEKALKNNNAKSVTITVMNPKNGEILAMTNKSAKSSNSANNLNDKWYNKAIQGTFEPGSIFKAITSEIALETKTSDENQYFLCNDSITINGTKIYNWDKASHGMLSFVDILKTSNNVGFAQLGLKIGKENLYSYINKFGFGSKTGIDLPGEASGIVKDVKSVGNVDLSNTAFGQGIATTQIQYMTAFNAIANGGMWIRPHIMSEVGHMDKDNKFIEDSKFNDFSKKRIMDENMTKNLRGYLEKVVSDGVGKNAYIKGYDIAGKTGTAQKANPDGGGYEPGKYVSSFAGMAPYEDPKVTLIVSIDEPDSSNYYASQTSAPVAKELFDEIYNHTDFMNK